MVRRCPICERDSIVGHGRFPGGARPFISWSRQNVILFTSSSDLMRVPASGGTPAPVTVCDKSREETYHLAPLFLPDGRHFLYHSTFAVRARSAVMVGSLDSPVDARDRKLIVYSQFSGTYAPGPRGSGYLLFERGGALMAQPFDSPITVITPGPPLWRNKS
jgi:hypothetical protein